MPVSETRPDIDEMERNRDIEGLIKLLSSKDCITRKEAVVALKKIADKRALFPLIHALKYEKWHDKYAVMASVRENAAEALGLLRDRSAVEPLIKALRTDEDKDVRWKSAWALGNTGDKNAVEPLIYALYDEHWPIRRFAASALGKIGDKKSVGSLISALNDEDWHVRKYAALALGKIGDERAVKPLVNALSDSDSDVRWKAVAALGKMKNVAVKPLIEAFNSGNWRIRGKAAEALGNIGDLGAIQPLINALTGRKKDGNKYVRGKVAEALGKIGDEKAVEPLIAAMEDPYIYVRIKAEDALNKINSARQVKKFHKDEISVKYPGAWKIIPLYDKRKIAKGYSARGITFSINKITDSGDLTLEELADTIKDAFAIQNNDVIFETWHTLDDIDVYIISGENTASKPVTRIMIAAFKLKDCLYYLRFAGGEETFKKEQKDVDMIIESFRIYIYN